MELLKMALEYYQDFAQQHSDDPGLQAEMGTTYHRIGGILRDLGRYDKAIEAFNQALAIRRELAKGESNENVDQRISLIETLSGIARVNRDKGDHDRAIAFLDEGESILTQMSGTLTPGQRFIELKLLNNRGLVLEEIGNRREEGADAYRGGLELVEQLLAKQPDMSEEDRKPPVTISDTPSAIMESR